MGDGGSLGKGLLHRSPCRIPMKRESPVHGSKTFIIMVESGFVKPYPNSHSGPEVKYLLQAAMSGKESLLGTSRKWGSVLSLCDRRSCPLSVEGIGGLSLHD